MPEVDSQKKQLMIEPERCIGCNSCAAACYFGHIETPALRYEELEISSAMPMVCRHCEDAPCVASCPRDAMYTDEDGIVRRSRLLCTGCGSCALACPFGVLDTETVRKQVAKCDFCVDRVRQEPARVPRCVSVCPSGALKFMDVEKDVPEESYVLESGRVVSSLHKG